MTSRFSTTSCLVIIGVALSLAARTATAAIITAATTGSPINFTPLIQSRLISVAEFDPSLGTLASITLRVSGGEILNVIATNTAPNSVIFSNLGGTGAVAATTAGPVSFNVSQTLTGLGAFGSIGNFVTVTVSSPLTTTIAGSKTLSATSLNLSQYIGLGSFLVSLDNTSSATGCTAPLTCTTNITGLASILVTYDFTPGTTLISEPGSALLLGVGLLGMTALSRRETT